MKGKTTWSQAPKLIRSTVAETSSGEREGAMKHIVMLFQCMYCWIFFASIISETDLKDTANITKEERRDYEVLEATCSDIMDPGNPENKNFVANHGAGKE